VKKLLSLVASLVVAFLAYALIGAPAPSRAAAVTARPSVVHSRQTAWVQVNLPETTARRIRIDINTPRVNGYRERWQFCEMEYVGLGTYRCGVDVRRSTPVKSMTGKWLGTLKVDGRTPGTVRFRTLPVERLSISESR